MPVRQIKSAPLCKICKSPNREKIDALLELRSDGGKLPDGRTASLTAITPLIEGLGIRNFTKQNATTHWREHCQVVSMEISAEIEAAVGSTIAILNSGKTEVDVDNSLRRMFAIGMAELEAKIASGQRSGIGPDLMVKITDAITRRKASDAQSELLRVMGGGIAAALGGGKVKTIETGHTDVVEAEAFEVEDAEYEEVGNGTEG